MYVAEYTRLNSRRQLELLGTFTCAGQNSRGDSLHRRPHFGAGVNFRSWPTTACGILNLLQFRPASAFQKREFTLPTLSRSGPSTSILNGRRARFCALRRYERPRSSHSFLECNASCRVQRKQAIILRARLAHCEARSAERPHVRCGCRAHLDGSGASPTGHQCCQPSVQSRELNPQHLSGPLGVRNGAPLQKV